MKRLLSMMLTSSVQASKHRRPVLALQPRFFSAQSSPELEFESSNNELIRVTSIQNVKPHIPTPHNRRFYNLSILDQMQVAVYVPFVFFYRNNNNDNDNIVFERSKLLKQSLSETLTAFFPFAGKLIEDSYIDCNDEGVYYVETRVDSDLDSFLAKPDYKLIQGLLTVPPYFKESTRGRYLVMIQVNFFTCGGFAIGMSNSHKLIDGATFMTFLNAWASVAKGRDHSLVYPSYVSSSLFPHDTQTQDHGNWKPYFPLSVVAIWPSMLKHDKSSIKRFVFDKSAVLAIKAKAAESGTPSSRVAAVTTFIWRCATIAARKQHRRPSSLQVAVNLRGKFSPPLARNTIGNMVWNAVAKCDADEELRFDSMVEKVNSGIAEIGTSFVEGFKEHGTARIMNEVNRLGSQLSSYETEYYLSTSMCKSGVYDADFGWGKPVWSCYGSLNQDVPFFRNLILLMDTSTGDGIEAWVQLSQEQMEILERDTDILSYASVDPNPLQC